MSGRVSFTPRVPDGPERPWTLGRRTRWWLVPPADLLTVMVVALLASASLHDLSLASAMIVQGVVSTVLAWLVAWLLNRPEDHLEATGRDGVTMIGATYAFWLLLRVLTGGGVSALWLMLACFLVIGQGGWRWLYGFAKASESITPKGVQRRLDAQEREQSQESMKDLVREPAESTEEPAGEFREHL